MQIAASVVALEHLYIMWLESFATTSQSTARVFGMSEDELKQKRIGTLLKNQGIYNGLLALLILFAAWSGDLVWTRLLLGYVVAVALYGGATSSPSIILKQGGPAIIALLLTFLS